MQGTKTARLARALERATPPPDVPLIRTLLGVSVSVVVAGLIAAGTVLALKTSPFPLRIGAMFFSFFFFQSVICHRVASARPATRKEWLTTLVVSVVGSAAMAWMLDYAASN